MTELNIVNPDGAPVIPAVPARKPRRTLNQAKGKMTLSEAEPVERPEGEVRKNREARLLQRKNRRTGTARLQGKVKRDKGVTLNGRG